MPRTTEVEVSTSDREEEVVNELARLVKKRPAALSEESDEEASSTTEEDDEIDIDGLAPKRKQRRMVRKAYDPDMNELEGVIGIEKADEKKGLVFGWASVMKKNGELVIDRENDVIEDEWHFEKAAYDFVTSVRVGGDNHVRKGVSHLVESMVFTEEKIEALGLPEDFPVGWWTGWQITDAEVMKGMAEGKYSGFSVHGKGKRKSISKAASEMTFDDIRSTVQDALKTQIAPIGCYCWIRDISDKWVVYEMEASSSLGTVTRSAQSAAGTFRRSYTIGKDGVTFGDPEQVAVKRVTQYITKGTEALVRYNELKKVVR